MTTEARIAQILRSHHFWNGCYSRQSIPEAIIPELVEELTAVHKPSDRDVYTSRIVEQLTQASIDLNTAAARIVTLTTELSELFPPQPGE